MEVQALFIVERNVFIAISVLLLLMYTIIRNVFPKVFGINFDFSKLYTFRVREEIGYSLKPFSKGQLFISGVYSVTLGFLILFFGRNVLPADSSIYVMFGFDEFWLGLVQWLGLSSIVYLFTFLKLGFLFLFSRLFNLGYGYQRQFADFFSSSSVFFLLLSFLVSIALYSQLVSVDDLVFLTARIAVFFLFYRTTLIYFKLLQTVSYSKLYIFSYICTTELIPLAIGLKYLIR